MKMMTVLFEKSLSPEQTKLRKLVNDACGPEGTKDESQLKQLLRDKPVLVESRAAAGTKSSKSKDENIDDVIKELKDSSMKASIGGRGAKLKSFDCQC